jgi:hypothetical protein
MKEKIFDKHTQKGKERECFSVAAEDEGKGPVEFSHMAPKIKIKINLN